MPTGLLLRTLEANTETPLPIVRPARDRSNLSEVREARPVELPRTDRKEFRRRYFVIKPSRTLFGETFGRPATDQNAAPARNEMRLPCTGDQMTGKVRSTKLDTEPTVSRPELLIDGSDEAFRHFVHDTLAFALRLQEIRNRLGQVIGLSGTQYTVLIAVAHLHGTGEKVGINMVADHLHFSGAFITIEINKLVAAGLVDKTTDADDRRRVVLVITEKARKLLNKLAPVQRPANDMLFGSLSAKNFEKLRIIMSDLVLTAEQTIHLLSDTPRT